MIRPLSAHSSDGRSSSLCYIPISLPPTPTGLKGELTAPECKIHLDGVGGTGPPVGWTSPREHHRRVKVPCWHCSPLAMLPPHAALRYGIGDIGNRCRSFEFVRRAVRIANFRSWIAVQLRLRYRGHIARSRVNSCVTFTYAKS